MPGFIMIHKIFFFIFRRWLDEEQYCPKHKVRFEKRQIYKDCKEVNFCYKCEAEQEKYLRSFQS